MCSFAVVLEIALIVLIVKILVVVDVAVYKAVWLMIICCSVKLGDEERSFWKWGGESKRGGRGK